MIVYWINKAVAEENRIKNMSQDSNDVIDFRKGWAEVSEAQAKILLEKCKDTFGAEPDFELMNLEGVQELAKKLGIKAGKIKDQKKEVVIEMIVDILTGPKEEEVVEVKEKKGKK